MINWQWLRTTLGETTQVSVPLSPLKAVSSTASASAHTCAQFHPHTCDHVRSSRSSSARDVFARGWREPSLLLPPISCLARGIHSNWKSKSKAWGLRRIWERRRGGPWIPHTRAHFNASVRESGYQSAAAAAQTVFFSQVFLFSSAWMSLRKVNAHSPQIHNLRPLKRHPALINKGSRGQTALYATHTFTATLQQDASTTSASQLLIHSH